MQDSNSSSYTNNLTYRSQFPHSEEHFPQRQEDPDVDYISESSSIHSRRNILPITINGGKVPQIELIKTTSISEALREFKKQCTRKSAMFTVNQMNQSQAGNSPLKSNYLTPLSRHLTNHFDQSGVNTLYNMEEPEQKPEPVRLMRVLKLLVNIQHFYRMLTKNTRIFNKLTQLQHNLVGDIVSVYSKNKKKGNLFGSSIYTKTFCNLIDHITQIIHIFSFPIFAPSSKIIRMWDGLISILILFSTFLLNLQLFFTMSIDEFSILFQLLFALSSVDIFIELNTGVVQKGNINNSRDFIVKTYIKQTLIYDILGNIPLFAFVLKIEINTYLQMIINLLFICKWIKISKILKWLTFYISYEKNSKNSFDLFRLLFFVIGICHIFCLFWHGLGMFEINQGMQNNWIASKNLLEATIFERYAYSFYFLAVTMVTVGYGDITPQNPLEIVFTTLTIFVTCIVYAFSLNTIGSIIENIEKKDKKYKENMQVIHGLMREENVSRELKIKVSNYIEYLYKESNEVLKKQEKIIINKLSTKLRNDLTLEIQGKYLSNIPLFKNLKQKDKISNLMEEYLYSPGEVIFNQGDLDDCSLFYIVKGSVQIFFFQQNENNNREELVVSTMAKQQYFGEISFISGNPRTLSAKAADFCRLYKIKREIFMQIIKENEQDFENFQMLKEAITLNDNFKFCSIYCSICNSGNHFSAKCPRTHLTLTKQVVLTRYSRSTPHLERFSYEIEYGCNFIELTEDEENQIQPSGDEIETLSKKGGEDKESPNQRIMRLRTSESHRFKKQSLNSPDEMQQQQLMTSPLQYDPSKNPQNRQVFILERTYSSSSQSPRSPQNDQKHQSQKKSQMAAFQNFQNSRSQEDKEESQKESKESASDSQSESSESSSQSSKSQSSKSSKPKTQRSCTSQSISTKNSQQKQHDFAQNNKASSSLGGEKIQEESKQGIFNKVSPKQVKGATLERPELFIQIPYSSTRPTSQNKISSKLFLELEKNAGEQHSKNVDRNVSQTNLKSINSMHSLKKQSSLANDLINLQQQNAETRAQNLDKIRGAATNPLRIQSNNHSLIQEPVRRAMRNTQRKDQLEMIQESIMAFMSEEKKKKSLSFNNPENLNQKKINQATSQFAKLPFNADKRQSSNRPVHIPSIFVAKNEMDENLLKLEQKIHEIIEPPDQVNYQMLQTFDKAKIFKYYLPHFNYPEIVKKWIAFQKKSYQKHFQFRKSLSKKKLRMHTKRKIADEAQ